MKPINLLGKRFGHLVAESRVRKRNAWGQVVWRCRCSCGRTVRITTGNLRYGEWKSCGCQQRQFRRQGATTHGGRFTTEYRIWQGMVQRCLNKRRDNYARYGGKGIGICKRWVRSFAAFLADMGPRPSPAHSLDRFPNGAGDYEPGNCRWATRQQQDANKSNRIVVVLDGQRMFLVEAAQRLGITYMTAHGRYKSGRLPAAAEHEV